MNGVEALLFDVVNIGKNDLLIDGFSIVRGCEISHTVEVGDVSSTVVTRRIVGAFVIVHDKE